MNIRAYHILSTIRGQQQHSLSSAVFLDRKQIKRKEKKKDEEDSVVSPARRTQSRHAQHKVMEKANRHPKHVAS